MLQSQSDNMNKSIAKNKQVGTREIWLTAAYELLIKSGVDSVKIKTMAEHLGLARSGFYWHFTDRSALLDALIDYWETTNTGLLVAQTNVYAETITEAMLNLFDCWHDESKFDPRLDLAVRNWARNDPKLLVRLDSADKQRIEAITNMFMRFSYKKSDAQVRSRCVIYTQIGYISMQVVDNHEERISRVPHYVEVFTGLTPSQSEFARFKSRYGFIESKAV